MTITPDDVFESWRNQAVKRSSPRAAYNAYTPRRVDKNQRAIVKDLRTLGIQVTHLHAVGEGVFDLLCSYSWLVVSVEVKDGSKPPSGRAFTPTQKTWNAWWTGLKAVACNSADVMHIAEGMKRIVQQVGAAGIETRILGNGEGQYQL